jgi:hypothetical protein
LIHKQDSTQGLSGVIFLAFTSFAASTAIDFGRLQGLPQKGNMIQQNKTKMENGNGVTQKQQRIAMHMHLVVNGLLSALSNNVFSNCQLPCFEFVASSSLLYRSALQLVQRHAGETGRSAPNSKIPCCC